MDSLQPGQELGPYRILNQVGKGGMATVYRAYHSATDRYVALKLLPRELAENPEFVGRFQLEAHTIARLEHAHILPVYDFGQADEHTYLIMRYLEAGTLGDRLTGAPLPLAEADRILSQLAAALQYAHARGVIHRDLKPSNVLVDASGNLFLTDFGIAKLLEGDARFTNTGTMIGTPAYMSPEQAQGLAVDQRSDLYSLGIILYEMVTGRVPFEADTPLAVVLKHVNAPLPPPSSIQPGLADGVEKVLLKTLAKNPEERYATAGDLLDAWRAALQAVPGLTPAAESGQPAAPALTVAVPAPAPAPAAPALAPAPARRGWGWLAALGGVGALGVAGCAVMVCLTLLLGQGLANWASTLGGGSTPRASQAVTEPVVAARTPEGGPPVVIPLESGLPRAVTYGGLLHTVTAAELVSEPRPEDGVILEGADWLARLAVRVQNTSDRFTYIARDVYGLRLADGETYRPLRGTTVGADVNASDDYVLWFAVPAGAQWEGAVLQLSETGLEPAALPLTGDLPPPDYPRAQPLPTPAEVTAPDGRLRYELLSVALDVEFSAERAALGKRFLKLEMRLTNLSFQSGVAIGPSHFRLLVDGVPLAPRRATIAVVDYQAALATEAVFEVPAGAQRVTLQLGDVTAPEPALVTLELNVTGE